MVKILNENGSFVKCSHPFITFYEIFTLSQNPMMESKEMSTNKTHNSQDQDKTKDQHTPAYVPD